MARRLHYYSGMTTIKELIEVIEKQIKKTERSIVNAYERQDIDTAVRLVKYREDLRWKAAELRVAGE